MSFISYLPQLALLAIGYQKLMTNIVTFCSFSSGIEDDENFVKKKYVTSF